jgi:hypothetical protein
MSKAKKLVTIANFTEPYWAHLAKVKLQAGGIKCVLTGEHFSGMYWLCSNIDGGTKLQVKETDASKAMEILESSIKDQQTTADVDLPQEPYDLKCPKCDSEDVEYEKLSKKAAFLAILILGFPISYTKRRYTCRNCRHIWK